MQAYTLKPLVFYNASQGTGGSNDKAIKHKRLQLNAKVHSMSFIPPWFAACPCYGSTSLRATSLAAILLVLTPSGPALAQTTSDRTTPFSLSGFGTLGLARASNPDAEPIRDASQPEGITRQWSARTDSIVGIQGNLSLTPEIEVVTQVVSHYRPTGNFAPEVTWAFAKYDPNPRLSFRLGRIGTEFLMQADSRMVGYSYLPVRPNMDFFGGIPINYADGADAQVRWPMGDGVLRAGLFTGVAREKLRTYDTSGSPAHKAFAGYEVGPWQFRYIHARSRLANQVPAQLPLLNTLTALGAASLAQSLDFKGSLSAYHSIGITYDDGTWQAQAAIDSIHHQTNSIENSEAGYLQLARRIGNVSPFVGYSRGKSSPKAINTGLNGPNFAQLNAALTQMSTRSHQGSSTYTMGARWDFMRNVDLKVQVDRSVGSSAPTILLYNNVRPGWNGNTTILSVALDFVF